MFHQIHLHQPKQFSYYSQVTTAVLPLLHETSRRLMKLIINEKLVAENVTLKDLDDLDFLHQNISLQENDDSFLNWIVVDGGAEIQFCSAEENGASKPQSASIESLENDFDPQDMTNAFKSFFVQDQQWLKRFQWAPIKETNAVSDKSDSSDSDQLLDDEEEWQSWDVMIDDQTPAVILCNTSIADLIDTITDQFVMFGLKLESPDDNGLATDQEQKFCEAIEAEITAFVGEHKGAAVGEITSAGVRQFYTYNEATESELGEFLVRIEREYSCSLNCDIEQDPDKFRYWSDLHPEEHLEEDDFADEVDE